MSKSLKNFITFPGSSVGVIPGLQEASEAPVQELDAACSSNFVPLVGISITQKTVRHA